MIDTNQELTNHVVMNQQTQTRPDVFLLLSILLFIILQPVLHHDNLGKLVLVALMFVPVIMVTVKLSGKKGWLWPSVVLALGVIIFGVASTIVPTPLLTGIKWGMLAVFLGVTVFGLFSYVMRATSVIVAHLNMAVSIYLLIGLQWFAIYSAIDTFFPGAIQCTSPAGDRQTDLLYFSLSTLSTLGYGDVLAINGEVRILATLEAITGVLYIAITVATLVSSFKQRGTAENE